jgi:hypothetical protein
MRPVIVFVLFGMAGCATAPQSASNQVSHAPTQLKTTASRETSVQLARYELGSYRYPASDSGQNESAVYRTTRVPRHLAAPLTRENISPTYDPLPPSAELAAELEAQRQITAQLRAMKDTMASAEKSAKEQYRVLVTHTDDVVKLRQQLEAERAHVRELEGQLEQQLQAPAAPVVAATPSPASTPTQGVKW